MAIAQREGEFVCESKTIRINIPMSDSSIEEEFEETDTFPEEVTIFLLSEDLLATIPLLVHFFFVFETTSRWTV